MRVRTATPADVAEVLALDPQGDPTDLRRRRRAEQFCGGELGWAFVAESGQAGLAGLTLIRPGHLLGLDELATLQVEAGLLRSGIGRELVAAALGAATTPQVLAVVPRPNLPARALLAGAGWSVSGRLDGLSQDGLVVLRTPNRPAPPPGQLFHLALREDWERAVRAGSYRVSTLGASLADVGFVHLSFARQVATVADRFYAGLTSPVVLLTVERARLGGRVVVEPVPGIDDLYPHLYGPLDCAAVSAVTPLVHDGSGRLILPPFAQEPVAY